MDVNLARNTIPGKIGGRHVARILVADDNSNVQKTVALALAELGVEVVSVSNGEAAVRKLTEFTPDLVLADIFMPVRNGYEVCEYVKKDPRFKQVPVVLLVGAFDPLDEREAQRVGADGILKKPFVPPDPLITMVKTLLERTLGDRLVTVSVSRPAAAASSRTEAGSLADAPLPAPEPFEEPMDLQPPPPIRSAAFEEGGRPVAFGQLLDAPEQDAAMTDLIEPVDNEAVLTSRRDATLGDPIFWRNDAPSPDTESTAEPEEDSTALDMHNWKPGEDSLTRRGDAALLQPIEPLELIRDGQDDSSASIVEPASIILDPASQASLTVQPGKAEELAANPIEWMATAPPEHAEEPLDPTPGWDEEIPAAHDAIDLDEIIAPALPSIPAIVPEPVMEKALPPDRVTVPLQAPENITGKTPEPSKTQPSLPVSAQNISAESAPKQSVEDTARSLPKHDWEDLAAMLRPGDSVPAAGHVAPVTVPEPVVPPSFTQPIVPESATQPIVPVSATQPIAPGLAAETVASAPIFPPPVKPPALVNSRPAPASPAQTSSPDPALIEAVVQRVLDKMRPQVVEIITKEFLRPIVEALVHREIKKQ
jgi:CheY-like chemotaxis protein